MVLHMFYVSILALILSISAAPNQKPLLPSTQLSLSPLPGNLDLLQTSIDELSLFLSNGSLTSVDLVHAYLHNIDRNNHQGLNLRAVIQSGPREQLLEIAKELDDERKDGRIRGPLHGIPMLVKDNMATDLILGMNSTAGNYALQQSKVKKDSEVVRKLRAAGAIIIGKANMAELSSWKAHGEPGQPELGGGATNGWSAVGGQTSSAYVEGGFEAGGDPLGSSSGTAVGISAGFAAAGLGSDTTGSVNFPAARAALFGIRATTGLVPTAGVVPITADLDAVGPIGFTTRNVASILDALTYNDGRYLSAAKPSSFRGLRLGLVRNNFLDEADGRMTKSDTCLSDTEKSLKSTMEILRKQGAEIVNVNMDLNFDELVKVQYAIQDVMTMTMEEDIGKYLMDLEESPVRSLKDVIKWNDAHADIEFPPGKCCQQLLIDAVGSSGRNSSEYTRAWETIHTLGRDRGYAYLFDHYNLDALVFSPELGLPTGAVAALGYAAGTAPMGYCENGMPIGILLVTKPEEEEKLINLMATYEEIMPKRKTPKPLVEATQV